MIGTPVAECPAKDNEVHEVQPSRWSASVALGAELVSPRRPPLHLSYLGGESRRRARLASCSSLSKVEAPRSATPTTQPRMRWSWERVLRELCRAKVGRGRVGQGRPPHPAGWSSTPSKSGGRACTSPGRVAPARYAIHCRCGGT